MKIVKPKDLEEQPTKLKKNIAVMLCIVKGCTDHKVRFSSILS